MQLNEDKEDFDKKKMRESWRSCKHVTRNKRKNPRNQCKVLLGLHSTYHLYHSRSFWPSSCTLHSELRPSRPISEEQRKRRLKLKNMEKTAVLSWFWLNLVTLYLRGGSVFSPDPPSLASVPVAIRRIVGVCSGWGRESGEEFEKERVEVPKNNIESCKLARTRGERKGRDVGPKGSCLVRRKKQRCWDVNIGTAWILH